MVRRLTQSCGRKPCGHRLLLPRQLRRPRLSLHKRACKLLIQGWGLAPKQEPSRVHLRAFSEVALFRDRPWERRALALVFLEQARDMPLWIRPWAVEVSGPRASRAWHRINGNCPRQHRPALRWEALRERPIHRPMEEVCLPLVSMDFRVVAMVALERREEAVMFPLEVELRSTSARMVLFSAGRPTQISRVEPLLTTVQPLVAPPRWLQAREYRPDSSSPRPSILAERWEQLGEARPSRSEWPR